MNPHNFLKNNKILPVERIANLRIYGKSPFQTAVIHGGPGAPGSMAPVAHELAAARGILEPLQTRDSINGQIVELRGLLQKYADFPVTLIGHSWGAMLAFLFTAQYGDWIRKLILIGSAPFEERYAEKIMETRVNRLDENDQNEFFAILDQLQSSFHEDNDRLLSRFGRLCIKTDSFDPITLKMEAIDIQCDLHKRVWSEAQNLRKDGRFLEIGQKILCPVIGIHGDYDPHPAEGVRNSLSQVVQDFRFILLKHCGHYPWMERRAKDEFFRIINDEL